MIIIINKDTILATLKTYGEQLSDVQQAIASVLTSQRYEINGRSVQRADLEWLHKREAYLTDKVSRFGANTIVGNHTTNVSMKVSFENEL